MYTKEALLKEAKEMLETVDEKTLLMVHAMLSVDINKTKTDWWDEMVDEQQGLEMPIFEVDIVKPILTQKH